MFDLINSDAYDYLDNVSDKDLLKDEYLEEQEKVEDSYPDDEDDSDESINTLEDENDDSSMYDHSLFEEFDDEADSELEDNLDSDCAEEILESDPNESSYDEEDDYAEEEEKEVVEEQTIEEPKAEPVVEEPQKPIIAPTEIITMQKIISLLKSGSPVHEYLSSLDSETQDEIMQVINKAKDGLIENGNDKMFTIPGTEISVAVVAESNDPMKIMQRRQNIGAIMEFNASSHWNSLIVTYNLEGGYLVNIQEEQIVRTIFEDWEWRRVEELANKLRARI